MDFILLNYFLTQISPNSPILLVSFSLPFPISQHKVTAVGHHLPLIALVVLLNKNGGFGFISQNQNAN